MVYNYFFSLFFLNKITSCYLESTRHVYMHISCVSNLSNFSVSGPHLGKIIHV